jgi:hypothetical protein
MEIDAPLKPPEFKRDEMGRFNRPGKTLSKTAKKRAIKKEEKTGAFKNTNLPGPGPGRPPGSLNKTTVQLKTAILNALDKAGGEDYLARLAVENSSAFASLLKSVLPTTLAAENDGGAETQITFTRIIVHPGGHREIEGVTPKQLPAPSAPVVEP